MKLFVISSTAASLTEASASAQRGSAASKKALEK
jgi:hypothetical protein